MGQPLFIKSSNNNSTSNIFWFDKIFYLCSKLHKNHLNNIGMYLSVEKKKEIFKKHGKSVADTGRSEGQIALFTYRISHLTEHLKLNRKDYGTQRALQTLVGKRRHLLDYLFKTDIERYRAIVKELKLRR